MKYSLNVFGDFKCKAGDCKHTCCALWEIDIDKKTLKKYKKIKGDFSEFLKKGVDFKNKRFNMINGRCAFLNDGNLCDLIINFGDDYLCDVCRLHPRFNNFINGRVESGVGLCCEVVADKLVNYTEKIDIVCVDKKRKKTGRYTDWLLEKRKELFSVLQDRNFSLSDRLNKILEKIIDKNMFFSVNYREMFLDLEILTEEWKIRAEKIDIKDIDIEKRVEIPIENFVYYFIYRHVINAKSEKDFKIKVLFSLLSALAIYSIYKKEKKDLTDIAREYSEEIEYSADNTEKISEKLEGLILLSEYKLK